jgi:two-component system response regulator (stage 0 sporulation protein F)
MSTQSTLELASHAAEPALEAPVAGPILVVEDEADLRSFIVEHLTALGYTVREAWFAEQALASIAEERPQLVLLDIALPGINGLEILRRIRRHDPTINIIMMTGNQDVVLARSTIQLGAMDYVFKPFELDRFDRAIAAGMGKPVN